MADNNITSCSLQMMDSERLSTWVQVSVTLIKVYKPKMNRSCDKRLGLKYDNMMAIIKRNKGTGKIKCSVLLIYSSVEPTLNFSRACMLTLSHHQETETNKGTSVISDFLSI